MNTEATATATHEVLTQPRLATAEQMDRLIDLFERMVEELERSNEIYGREAALNAWHMGQGKHPDD